jgi:hypothetical protein
VGEMHYDRNSSAARTAASAALSAELRLPLGRLITSGGRSSTTNTSRRAVLRAPMTASYAGQLRPAVSVHLPALETAPVIAVRRPTQWNPLPAAVRQTDKE